MSEFGLKIHNIEAATLLEYNLGLRKYYTYNNAMFTNSLLQDYLKEIGLKDYKGRSTRDLICLKFGFGCQSFEEHEKKLRKKIKNAETDEEREKYLKYLDDSISKKHLYHKLTVEDLRKKFYCEGATITYRDRGNKEETIHYKMLYRTPGKAKQGSCMFINEKLYDRAINFMRMGISLPEKNAPIVEIGAYSPLVSSSIVGRIKINPSNILVLKDVDSFVKTKVVAINTDDHKRCTAEYIDNYQLKNTMFDGQALIDESIFPAWADGYILLRQHFCKMAAFESRIQLFMKDYFGTKYEDAEVEDMFGRKMKAKDVLLITTDNAMKWLKFDLSFEYWAGWVKKNGSLFGIVKTAHCSKLGEVQKMSYQMVNSLSVEIMPQVSKETLNYIDRLKNDDEEFLKYLDLKKNFINDFEVLLALVKQDPSFIDSTYFRDRRYKIIETYRNDVRNGKLIQRGDNLVIVGSPFAMLMHAVGEDPIKDPTFETEEIAIQCYTEKFIDGDYLAEFRSPFNSRNNLGSLHNHKHPYLQKYIKVGEQCIAVNMNHTTFQSRNNGSDMDSDSIYVTSQPNIAAFAKYCVLKYPTVENMISMDKTKYNNTLEDFARADSTLAASAAEIGESSNLAQLALTYSFNFDDDKYIDYAAILAVLAQCSIDGCKRKFDVDISSEIRRIKQDMNVSDIGLPSFWFDLRRKNKFSKSESKKEVKERNLKKLNQSLVCPMNYIHDMPIPRSNRKSKPIPLTEFFVSSELKSDRRKNKKAEELILRYQGLVTNQVAYNEDFDALLLEHEFNILLEELKKLRFSSEYQGLVSNLIDRTFQITDYGRKYKLTSLNENKAILLKILYKISPKCVKICFSGRIS